MNPVFRHAPPGATPPCLLPKCWQATASIVCGLGAWVCFILWVVLWAIHAPLETETVMGLVLCGLALPCIILSSEGLARIQRGKADPAGKRQANLGKILGIAWIAIAIPIVTVPGILKARNRATASTILGQLRQTDAAKDQYALEKNKEGTVRPQWADLTPWLKAGSKLALSGGKDNYGNPILIGTLSERLRVHPRTKKILEDVTGGDTFWGPYS
ncbi:MAG: hypothetical protein HY360_26310 [Verrucomicrobia bacterium]|nr:hypothetical protein [Verrucomicrobiota bacterium]